VGRTWSRCYGDKRRLLWARAAAHLVLSCGAVLWLMLHEVGGRDTQAVVGMIILIVFMVLAFWGAVFSGLLPARVMRLMPAALVGTVRRKDSDDLRKDPGLVVIYDSQPTSSQGRWQPLFTTWCTASEEPPRSTKNRACTKTRSWSSESHAQDTFHVLDNSELHGGSFAGKQGLSDISHALSARRTSTVSSAFSDISHAGLFMKQGESQGLEAPDLSRQSSRHVTIPRRSTTMETESALSDVSSDPAREGEQSPLDGSRRLTALDMVEISEALAPERGQSRLGTSGAFSDVSGAESPRCRSTMSSQSAEVRVVPMASIKSEGNES